MKLFPTTLKNIAEPETAEDFQSVSEEAEATESDDFSGQPVSAADEETEEEEVEEISVQEDEVEETDTWSQPTEIEVENETETYQPVVADTDDSSAEQSDYQFKETAEVEESEAVDDSEAVEMPQFDGAAFEPVETISAKDESLNGKAESFVPEPAPSESAPTAPVKSRFSDRNVDLPIEVGEDERRLHNDARRFARLLVSEIKLYNEQKVKEGREAQDLYERLREAIDRSRDMYNKRVQPPVAAKFDYFHYELVSSLAEGEENRLGGSYPGAAV